MHCFAAFYVVIILSCGRVNQKFQRHETRDICHSFLDAERTTEEKRIGAHLRTHYDRRAPARVYTQCDSNPETWNQHKERAMGTNKLAIQVNERLNDFRVKIIDIRTKLLAEAMRPMRRRSSSATSTRPATR